jgi:YfiH family protein
MVSVYIGTNESGHHVSAHLQSDFRLEDDGIYRCAAFQHFLWQEHGFGTRMANPTAAITLRQIHSGQVWNAHRLAADRQQEGDALFTDDILRGIGVRTADCVPLLLLDTQNRAVAAVHAGWRGSASAIVRRTLEKMTQDCGTDAANVCAALGPCIRECCYEVGDEVARQFVPLFPEWEQLTGGKLHLDLPEANRRHLLAAGVSPDHIFDCCLCTSCNPEQFFSYRREPQNPGRMLSAICRLV